MTLRVSKSAGAWLLAVMSDGLIAGPTEVGQQVLDQASALRSNHQYAGAIAAYTDMIAQPGMPVSVTDRARLEKPFTKFENPRGWRAAWRTITSCWVTSAKAIVAVRSLLLPVGLSLSQGASDACGNSCSKQNFSDSVTVTLLCHNSPFTRGNI